jgi:beta-ribofuranosylaminobenzene 5'-phosphate synthase
LYATAAAARQVEFLRRQGVAGAGQSSWGPAVFAVVEDVGRAEDLAHRLRQEFALGEEEVMATPASNGGAQVRVETNGPG